MESLNKNRIYLITKNPLNNWIICEKLPDGNLILKQNRNTTNVSNVSNVSNVNYLSSDQVLKYKKENFPQLFEFIE